MFRRSRTKTGARPRIQVEPARDAQASPFPPLDDTTSGSDPTSLAEAAAAAAVDIAPPARAANAVRVGPVDFPALPLGVPVWSDRASNVTDLDETVARLPDSLVVLSGSLNRGALLIGGGRIADAVWIGGDRYLMGDQAARSILSAREGAMVAYGVGDARIIEALPMLWRSPRIRAPVAGASIDAEAFAGGVSAAHYSCALLISGSSDPGVALFHHGDLVGVYTAAQPSPVDTADALRGLLDAPGALVVLLGGPADAGRDLEIGGTSFPLARDPGSAAEAQPAEVVSPSAQGTADLSAGDAGEFVPPRIQVDFDALSTELMNIADGWLGASDAAPVHAMIRAARPGVDDFVAAIAAVASMEIPGHEHAEARAMAREMHFRAAEVLCGV